MEVHAHDWCCVATVAYAVVDAGFGAGAVISVTWVQSAFFCADEEGCWIRGRESHACGAQILGFGGRGRVQVEIFLGLGEHVDCPAADDAIGGAGDDVVCVLGADDFDAVDWVGVAASAA